MTSKASNQRDITDVIKKQKRDNKKAAGIARAQASGISGSDTAIAGGQKTQAGSAGASNVTQDLLMNTYDIRDVDRLYFSTTAGSADVLTANDTGIESKSSYNGTSYTSYGLNFQVPANNIHTFFIGTTEKINIGTGYITLNDNVATGGSIQLSAMTAPSATGTTQRKLYVDTADNHLKIRTNTTSIDLETSSGGGAGLGDANVWTNVNTFQNTVNFTGSTVNLGDSTNDRVNFISQVGTDINMGTYDVINLDRLKFATTAGAGSALGTSDTGIEAQFSGGSSAGIKFQTPANNFYQFFSGSTEKVNIGSSLILLNDDVTITDDLTVQDNVTIQDDLTVNDDVTLGSSISDDIELNGRVEWGNSYTASAQAYPSLALGYITIKVNGSNRNIWVS